MKHLLTTLAWAGLMLAAARPAAAAPFSFDVVVNTSTLIGNPGGPFSLDFQLNGAGPNSATVSDFEFGGGTPVAPATLLGTASGSLATSVDLADGSGSFANEFYEAFNPGAFLKFNVTLTTNVTATPDAFSFSILDGSLFNIPTTGVGDSLLLVNLTSPVLGASDIQLFRGSGVPGGPDYAGVTDTAAPVPEPASLMLLATGLGATVTRQMRRRRVSR